MCALAPIHSPLTVMEPGDIPEITPPTLLALSTMSSRVHNLTVGSLCTCIYFTTTPPSLRVQRVPVEPSQSACGTEERWMRFWRCFAPSDAPCPSPVRSDSSRCKRRGSFRLRDSPSASTSPLSFSLSLALSSLQTSDSAPPK